jgi:hypothetical protein
MEEVVHEVDIPFEQNTYQGESRAQSPCQDHSCVYEIKNHGVLQPDGVVMQSLPGT